MDASALAGKLTQVIINPLIAFLFAAGLLVFLAGMVEFIVALNGGGDTSLGKRHMRWGIVGLFIMTVAYALLQFIANTLNVAIPK